MLTQSNQLSTGIKVALMCHQNSVNSKFSKLVDLVYVIHSTQLL